MALLRSPGAAAAAGDIDEAEPRGGGGGRADRSERSGKTAASVATVFRKALLDGRSEAPPPLRRLRLMGLVVVIIVAVAAISLTSVASSNLNAVLSSTQLVWSGANRSVRVAVQSCSNSK